MAAAVDPNSDCGLPGSTGLNDVATLYNRFAGKSLSATMTESSSRKLIIAIDGPAGAGKSTIASRLARKLDYISLESGAMYRALALKAILNDVSSEDEAGLLNLAQNSRIELEPAATGNRVLLDGQDVTQRVRERDVSEAASRVSVHPKVREWMVKRQQEMGADGGVIMEGRDIGTKVFPHADVKIFLDADPVERERRRLRQQSISGTAAELAMRELRLRDQRDRNRATSPLVAARDALILDSTHMSEDEVLRRVEQAVRDKLG
jgi:CMP/dCMP kinase